MSDIQKTAVGDEEESVLSIQDLIYIYRQKWYWFVISVFVCFCLGVLYLAKTVPMYTRTAELMIKEDRKGTASAADQLSDLGFLQPKSNIDNEMLTLKSPSLMEEVVKRLKLNDSYSIKNGLRRADLYKQVPVALTPLSDSISSFSCEFVIAEDMRSVSLGEFKYKIKGERVEPDFSQTVAVGDTVLTPVGPIAVSVSPWEGEGLTGRKIRYRHVQPKSISQAYAAGVGTERGAEKATIIEISFRAPSIEKAEDIINTLIQVYNDRWVLDKNQMAVSTSHFIGERLGVIESELGNVDADISSYKSEHLLPDVEAASRLFMTQSEETRRELNEVNSQIQVARHIRSELSGDRIDQPLPTSSTLQSPDLNQQIALYNELVLERNRLIDASSESNPLVEDRTRALHSMRGNILNTVDNIVAALNARAGSLRSQQSVATGQLAANPNQAKYLLSVERQQKVKEQLYLYLLQKREENELGQAFTSYNTRLITPPIGLDKPTSPNARNVMLILFMIGMILPAGILYVRQLLDTKVRSRRDLESLSVPYIGEIPSATPKVYGLARFKKRAKVNTDDQILVKSGSSDIINESFRVVRSNLEFVGSRKNEGAARTMMVTSAVPGSGKTFVSMNLGAAEALKGKRTIVVDLDMRRASLSHYVGSPRVGVSSVLIGKAKLDDAVVRNVDGMENLAVLPVGAIPPNPSELMYTDRFAEFIEELKAEYECVILDCPPAEIVADAKILSKYADITIWVVRAGLYEKSLLHLLQRYYDENRYRSLCLLLNCTDPSHTSSYQRYGYASYYNQNVATNSK